MIELNLSLHRRARIWINELPNACFDPINTLKEIYPVGENANGETKNTCIAVELNIPAGGRIIYGLLGARFYRNSVKPFSLEIRLSDSLNVNFVTSIYRGLDNALVGLPQAYSKSVKIGFLRYFETNHKDKPKGNLIFNCAAYSEVGSNERIFEQLAFIICRCLFSNQNFESDKEYIELFE